MQIERVEAGATAPTTAWPPLVAETSEDSWENCGAINAMVSQQCWTAKDTVTYPGTVPMSRARATAKTTSARARAHTNGKSKYDGNKGSNLRDVQGRWKGEQSEPSWSRQEHQKGDGKSGGKEPRYGKCYTCGGDHFTRDCPKGGRKGGFKALEAWETWEEPPLVEHAQTT